MASIEDSERLKGEVEHVSLKHPSVIAVDVGTGYVGGCETDMFANPAFVETDEAVANSQAIPKEIRGVPTELIERGFLPHRFLRRPR